MAPASGDPAMEPRRFINPYKNLDLPPQAYTLGQPYLDGIANVARPGFNATGREVELQLNAYPITNFPTLNVYQYDVTIVKVGKEQESLPPRTRKIVWSSGPRKNKWKQMLFDGSKLAWSSNSYDDPHGILIDLSAQPGGTNGNNPGYRVIVRKSKAINLQILENWLAKKGSFDERVLEALNFLDHLLREWPSTRYTPVKRAFFDQDEEGRNFDSILDVRKGFYQAIRPALSGTSGRLIVNVDSVLCTFWRQISLSSLADSFLDKHDWNKTADALRRQYVEPQNPSRGYKVNAAHKHIWSKLNHLEVKPVFQGNTVQRTFHIHKIHMSDANTWTFPRKDPATQKEQQISVADHFKEKYNKSLICPGLPVVEMTNRTVYPMECLHVAGLQRYNHKLSDRQTADMIKVAVRRPNLRFEDIATAKGKLSHDKDPILRHFGMQISQSPIVTKARLLVAPEIQFANGKHNPLTQGRWDLRNKKFLETNKTPLKSWGIGIFKQGRGPLSVAQAEEWMQGFMKQYAGHGGKIAGRPVIIELTGDTAEAVHRLFMATGNHFKQRPQMLLFVVPNKDTLVYHRIKKSCDCRFGVPSQVMQKAHVEKKQPQYMSNVAMKINAKLGGVTCKAAPKSAESMARPGSIIIGADVSHAAPGSVAPSLTAISVSADQNGVKYMGKCETGHSRVEMIDEENMKEMLTPLVDEWTKSVGNGRRPQCVYYFRDGVSTGQFAHVLEKEVPIIKDVISHGSGEKMVPKVTVIIANKRHHIRAAPRPNDRNAADKNGNALPGTLIERDVTSPHDWDFLMISHVALQGTAKPVHYHVIRDEMKHQPAQLQNMINNHCYQYVRSTTSVSLFPAVYYAHLISNRARCLSADEFIDGSDESQDTGEIKHGAPKRLLQMIKNETRNHLEMWFI